MNFPTPERFDDFVLLGDAVDHHRTCNCHECQESLENLAVLGQDRLDFAQRLSQMVRCGDHADVLFTAQMEDWNEQQLREALENN